MKLINHSLNIALLLLMLVVGPPAVGAFNVPFSFFTNQDTTLVCNDLVQVSMDENCQALFTGDEILEGYNGSYSEITVEITDQAGVPVANPVTSEHIGETLIVKVIHSSGNSCWGSAHIEDKWGPQLTCQNYTIQCFQNLNTVPLPTAIDNCDASPTINVINEFIDESDLCDAVTITRTYIAFDDYGNASNTCSQVFTTVQPSLPDFPEDTVWACHIYNAYPNVINATKFTDSLHTTGSGVPNVALGNYCPYTVTKSDAILSGCGSTFTIVRTWTVLNWCTGQIIMTDINGDDNVQIVKVADHQAPLIVMPPYTVGANVASNHPGGCVAMNFLPPATVTDSCHAFTQRIITSVGEAQYLNGQNGANGGLIPFPGLPLGNHTIIYIAEDICGNVDTLQVTVTIADLTAPVTICDELTTASLGAFGEAEVFAETFDDGSYDACCLDSFAVRRMTTTCDPTDLTFGNSVKFCCEDVGDTVTVVFRAYDCSGNFNDCMVQVIVEEKIAPILVSCPAAVTISCDFYAANLEVPLANGNIGVLDSFGIPVFTDNCEVIYLDTTVTNNLNQCLEGGLLRSWQVTDPGNNLTLTCNQLISVAHVSDWVVEFPADVTVTCTQTLPATGEPKVFYETCELVAVSHDDEIFTVVPDVCFKILRTWNIINWCVVGAEIDQEVMEQPENQLGLPFPQCDLDGDGDCDNRTFRDSWRSGLPAHEKRPSAVDATRSSIPDTDPDSDPWDGFITYQQVIKVIDDTAPVVHCDSNIQICILETDCDVTFSLPTPDVDDCSQNLTYTALGDLGSGLGPFINVPPGVYQMVYKVDDHCNNVGICQTTVTVRDCKKPTPYCINGLSVTLEQDTMVTITAETFDAGSFDNCPGDLIFSFSPDINITTVDFDCFSLGFVVVQVFVTDAAGNQDFCETFVFVDDNIGVCIAAPLVAGQIETEAALPVANVMVNLNGSTEQDFMTTNNGAFSFEVQQSGDDYTLAPEKDTNPLNGVTTYDLVLISKHILGTQILDSPYKIIAADANHSNAITTSDLVALRKMVLQIDNDFVNNTSWRFVNKAFVFPNPQNPWQTPFPELLNLNNVTEDILNADFVAIKIGDVNLNADPQQ